MGIQVEDLVFEIRDASFNRVAQLLPTDGLTTFKATLRFNNVGTWEISIPEVSPRADLLRTPGYGLVVTGPGGTVWMSGPTVAATNTRDMGLPYGEWAIRGATDAIILGERLAYPTPGSSNVAAQSSAYDTRTGTASTVMYGYVTRNLVSGTAPAARVVAGLTCATDTTLGSSVSFSARFDNLGEMLSSLANVSSPQLGFDIKQSGSGLQFAVYQPTDRTGTIRMDTDNETLQKATYGYGYGKTRAIVGGGGEGTARQFVEVASSPAESTWSRRVEAFVDQRQESDATKLTQAGTDLLNESGGTITSMDVVPTNDTTMSYGTDFYLGDKVTVAVAAQQVTGIVSTVQVTIGEDGVRVGCTIGNPVGFDYEAVLSKRQTDTTANVSALQRVEAVQGTLVPAAGTTGQALIKSSGADYATAWGDPVAALSVSTAKLADASVTNVKLANSSVTVNGNAITLGGSGDVTASQITSGTLPIAQGGSGVVTGAGLVPIIPSSVSSTGGTVSYNSTTGKITATGSNTAIVVNGVFSSTYTNYRVVMNDTVGADYMSFRSVNAGTVLTSNSYSWQNIGAQLGTIYYASGFNSASDTRFQMSAVTNASSSRAFDVFAPFISSINTSIVGHGRWSTASPTMWTFTGGLLTASTTTGFQLSVASGTFASTISVYGYKD